MVDSTSARGTMVPVRVAIAPAASWTIGLTGIAAAAASIWLALSNDQVADPGLRAAVVDWVTLPYIGAGLVAWWRRPDSRLGPLMVAGGFANFAGTLQWAEVPLLATIGYGLDFLPPVVFLHVFLAFPNGLLGSRAERRIVASAYTAAIGLRVLVMALDGVGPNNLLAVADVPAAAEALRGAQLLALSALMLAGAGILVVRGRRPRSLRPSLTLLIDAFSAGLVMIALLFLSHLAGAPWIEPIRWATFAVVGLAPLVFLAGLLDARLARSRIGDLVVELQAKPAPAQVQDALGRALRDPSLELAYWLPQFESWADLDGRSVELPPPGDPRVATLVERDGVPVAALVHDRALANEPELLEAVNAAAGIALDNARLYAELKARLAELAGSRTRILEAGQKERQRLERNLHDGAQQRLVALSLELGRLEERLDDDPPARSRLDRAREEIARSLDELRDVARGLHPAVLSAHGLEVALESVAAGAPIPVRLDVELGGRLAEGLEVAAYYVVCESLANVGKHARATSAAVVVRRSDGHLVVEVVDDGVGGADTERGSGLRGLADRVEAFDGRLRVWSPNGRGTRVRAEIPCG